MGLFGNSISDNILSEVQTINRCVTHIEQLFNKYRGVVPANASKIENERQCIIASQTKINVYLERLNGYAIQNLSVPWKDDKYFSIMDWMFMLLQVLSQVENVMNDYYK